MKPTLKQKIFAAALIFLSFSGCGGGDEEKPAPPQVSDFYGRFTLNYKFNTSATVFTDVFDFSSTDLSDDKAYVVDSAIGFPDRIISCDANGYNYEYSCLLIDFYADTIEIFEFDMDKGYITEGVYEYCLPGVDLETCLDDFFASPDGIVYSGGLTGSAGKAMIQSKVLSSTAQKKALKQNLALQTSTPHPMQNWTPRTNQADLLPLAAKYRQLYNAAYASKNRPL